MSTVRNFGGNALRSVPPRVRILPSQPGDRNCENEPYGTSFAIAATPESRTVPCGPASHPGIASAKATAPCGNHHYTPDRTWRRASRAIYRKPALRSEPGGHPALRSDPRSFRFGSRSWPWAALRCGALRPRYANSHSLGPQVVSQRAQPCGRPTSHGTPSDETCSLRFRPTLQAAVSIRRSLAARRTRSQPAAARPAFPYGRLAGGPEIPPLASCRPQHE